MIIQKFTYKPPRSLVLLAFFGVLGPIGVLTVISDGVKHNDFGYEFILELVLTLSWCIFLLRYTLAFIKRKSLGWIIVSETHLELPVFVGKPDKIDLSDIRYVTETNPEDGLVKISTTNEFYRFYKELMSPEDFEELKSSLRKLAEDNRISSVR